MPGPDAAILLGSKPPDAVDPLKLYIQAQQARGLQQDQQIQALKIQAAQRAQAGEQQANAIVAGLPRSADGTFDVGELTQRLAKGGIPLSAQEGLLKSIDGVNGVIAGFNTAKVNHRADLANVILNSHKPGEPVTPDAVHLGVAAAKAIGLASAEDEQALTQAMAAGSNPEQVLQQIRSMSAKYADEKPVVLPEGATLVKPESGTVVATGAPKTAKTESELAADAANPKSPTAAQSQAALGMLKAETPSQKETRLRLEAANAESARHNRADETLARQRLQLETGPGGAGLGAGMPDVPAGQKNEPFLQTLPATQAGLVKALTDGRMQFPSGFALKSPYWQGLLQAVAKYDPSFDAINYNARAKTRADFTSGKAAQQVNAINTVIGHLHGLSDAAEALNNSDLPSYNSVTNYLSKAIGRPTVTNFDTIKKAVADEVTRVWRQAGGSVQDIEAAQKNLDASGSPAQLRGAIATYADLLQSKLGSLNEQYRQGMGTDKIDMVTPAAQQALAVLEQRAGRAPVAAPAVAPASTGSALDILNARRKALGK